VRPDQHPPKRPKGVSGYFSHHGISKSGTFIERLEMKIHLDTTIGSVRIHTEGHVIHIYTEKDETEDFYLNLWNPHTKREQEEPSLRNVLNRSLKEFCHSFDNFGIYEVKLIEAKIPEILGFEDYDFLKRYRSLQTPISNEN
jgi:hypothetical protein